MNKEELEQIKKELTEISKWPWVLDHEDTYVQSAEDHMLSWFPYLLDESKPDLMKKFREAKDAYWVVGDIGSPRDPNQVDEEDLRGPRIKQDCQFIAKAPERIDALIKMNEKMLSLITHMDFGVATNKDFTSHDQLIESVKKSSEMAIKFLEDNSNG